MVKANVKGNLNVLSVERKITNLEEYNRPFSLDELRKSLDKAHDTACGSDDIHYQFLKHLPESALQTLLDLMNDIWETGDLSSIWKLANVIPIPKPGKDHSEPSNYPPIALTSCICKTMEWIINARLVWFLESNGLLSNIQCGFRHGRSTLDHLVCFETFIRNAFAKK
jgi:potassium voltage-gated channel Eag-related subfamily H protein 8